jgi:YHS domain-containing protein
LTKSLKIQCNPGDPATGRIKVNAAFYSIFGECEALKALFFAGGRKELQLPQGLYQQGLREKAMHKSKISIFFSLLFIFSTGMAEDAIYTSLFSSTAVGGYDPVAYFTEGRPVKGNKAHHLRHQGATWYFASEEHRRLFQANPDRYAPQYGGYCAWAVAHDTTASGDPLQWTIHRGRLYLNYDADIQKDWAKDKAHWIREADRNWPAVLK